MDKVHRLVGAYGLHALLTFVYITALGIVGENLAHRLRIRLFSSCALWTTHKQEASSLDIRR